MISYQQAEGFLKRFTSTGKRWNARWQFHWGIKNGQNPILAPIRAKVITLDNDQLSAEQYRRYAPRATYVRGTLLPQLEQMGLKAEIFKGITPRELAHTDAGISFLGRRFQWGRDRDGNLAAPYQICLVLVHMKIWEEAAREQYPVLVLEDDAYLEEKDKPVVSRILFEYQWLPAWTSKNSLLYLQSTCPWRPGKCLKTYPASALIKANHWFFKISKSWQDVSGTGAYLVSPQTCRTLVDHFSTTPLWNIDGMLDDLKRSEVVKFFLPKKHKRNFKLHPKLD